LLENILVNTTIGKDPFCVRSKMVPNYYQYKKTTFRKVKRNGLRFELDISNFFDWYVYFGFADDWIENMLSFLSPGDVAVDVGVNNGKSLLRIAKAVGKTGKVYGFEPTEENFFKANRNISINGLKNIILHKLALGEGKEKVFLNEPNPQNTGLNFFTTTTNDTKNLIQFTTISLDEVLKDNTHSDISLLHVDVEGFETAVIKGSAKTINRFMPVIFLKINHQKLTRAGSSSNELAEILMAHNYELYDADNEKEVVISEINNLEEASVYCLPKNQPQ